MKLFSSLSRIGVCAVTAALCATTFAGAVTLDTEPSENTILCKSPAGYNMTVKNYYEYMKRFAGTQCTTYFNDEEFISGYMYKTACSVDSDGTLRVSVCSYINDSYEDYADFTKQWFGITIYNDYNFCITETGTEYKVVVNWQDSEYHSGFDSEDSEKYEAYFNYSSYTNEFSDSMTYQNGVAFPPMAMLDDDASRVCSWFGYDLSFLMNGFLWDTSDAYGEYIVNIPVIETIMGGNVTGVSVYSHTIYVQPTNSDLVKYWNFSDAWNGCEYTYRMSHI